MGAERSLKAIGYGRVVPRENAREALYHQKSRVEQFCKAKGIELVSFFEEQISGDLCECRDQLEAAIESADTGMAIVVVRLDRISSSKKIVAGIFERCKERGISVMPTAGPQTPDEMRTSLEVTVIPGPID